MKIEFVKKNIRQITILIVFGIIAIWLNSIHVDPEMFKGIAARYGYLGVFAGAMFSGFNILVPIPIIAFFPFFVESGLQAHILVAIIALGMSIGDTVGFIIGKSGRAVVTMKDGKITRALKRAQDKHSLIVAAVYFLYAAFAPVPNELVVLPGAYMGLRFWQVILPVLLGNIVFNSLIALGLVQLFK